MTKIGIKKVLAHGMREQAADDGDDLTGQKAGRFSRRTNSSSMTEITTHDESPETWCRRAFAAREFNVNR
jgi:hypothetical protein